MSAIVLGIIAVAGLAVIATVIGLSVAAIRGGGWRVTRSRNHARSYDGSSASIWAAVTATAAGATAAAADRTSSGGGPGPPGRG